MESSSVKAFGLWRATSLVTGNIVGSGIFLLPASLGVFGTLGLFGWVVTSLGSICLALVFARLSSEFPKLGGPYIYSREAFGDFVGFQMAWSYWVGTWASNAAISTAFVSYLSFFIPALRTSSWLAFIVAASAVWFFTLLNCVSLRSTGAVQVLIAVAKVVPLLAIGIFGVFSIRLENFLPINPTDQSMWHVIGSASALTLFAFLGLESATIPADNVINPTKTIPRATVLGTLIAAIIYIWSMVVLLGVMPAAELAISSAPFADGASRIFGAWAGPVIGGCAVFAAFGTLNGWILVQGQIPVAAARDGVFPKVFSKLTKQGTPAIGLIISSILMTGMLYMNYQANFVEQFTAIVTFTTFAVLLPYLYSTVADLYFLCTRPYRFSKWQLMRSLFIALLGFLYTLIVVMGAGQEAVYLGMVFIFAGFPVYVLLKSFNNGTQHDHIER